MYTLLDTKKTTELFLVRHGWFSPEYELTDNVSSYGNIVYQRLSRRKATATTVTSTWIFQYESLFSRTILIIDQNTGVIGRATRELFARRTVLNLQTGFRAEFYKPSIWSRVYAWASDSYGKIMHIENKPFSLRDAIYVDQSLAPVSLVPLLIFLGSYLVILSRRRRTKH